jgi:flagellar biosynthesis/type III secretory pathway protein FliH
MPTLTVTHEAPLELIRQHPDLAVDLVRAMTGVPVPDDARADLGPKCRQVIQMGQILEDMMSTTEWKDDFIESYVRIGIEQGLEQGLEQGREQGLEQGAANAKAQDVLKVMDTRGLKPTQEQRAKITAAAGITQLDLWFDRALTAGTAADVFKDPSGE